MRTKICLALAALTLLASACAQYDAPTGIDPVASEQALQSGAAGSAAVAGEASAAPAAVSLAADCAHIQYCRDPRWGGVTCVSHCNCSYAQLQAECSGDAWAVCRAGVSRIVGLCSAGSASDEAAE